MKNIKVKFIKDLIRNDLIRNDLKGINAFEVIPIIDLREPLKDALSRQKKGLIPKSYKWNKIKTEYAYSYKNYKSWARSIIVVAKYYFTDENYSEGPEYGRIARFTWRNNYSYLTESLEFLIKTLEIKLKRPIKAKLLSNYTSIPEKVVFNLSKLASLGKNSVLINSNMGSYFVIGEALTDIDVDFTLDFTLKKPDFSICGKCRRCIDACPTGAIIENGVIDTNRCFQYISENLILMPLNYREKWGNRLYGCSTCIDVCPFNAGLKPLAEKHNTGYVGPSMNLLDVLNLKESDWEKTFFNNQIGIRDRLAIIKNAIVSLGCIEYKGSLDTLYPYLNYENSVIRAYASWAIGRININRGKKLLFDRYRIEEDKIVKTEIENFL